MRKKKKSFEQKFNIIFTTKQFTKNMSEDWRSVDWNDFPKRGIHFHPRPIFGITFYSLIKLLVSSSIHSCFKMHPFLPTHYSWWPDYPQLPATHRFLALSPYPWIPPQLSRHWSFKISSTTNELPYYPLLPFPNDYLYLKTLQFHRTSLLAWYFFENYFQWIQCVNITY